MELRNLKILSNYAEIVVKNNSKRLKYEDWEFVGKDIKTDKPYLKPVIAKRIVMSNLELANQRILDILAKNGITDDKPFEIYEKALKIAESKESSADLIKIADRYTELLDLKPQKVQYTETRKEINYDNLLPSEVRKTITTTKNLENKQKQANDNE